MGGAPNEDVAEPRIGRAVEDVGTIAELALALRWLRRREARQREGAELTCRQLATKAGWSHTAVAAYLTGKILPPTDRFDTLVRLLGATAGEQGKLATARDRVAENRRPARTPSRPAGTARRLPSPRQLPADPPGFVGRANELARLDKLPSLARRSATAAVAAVIGDPGIGKSALAVHWAHRVKHQFLNGQLYADIRGSGPGASGAPERILDGFLVALGVTPAELPPGVDAKAALYRSLLARRRVLVLVDNAVNDAQVRPLLPASAGCLVLVTGRDRLGGLVARERAYRLCLQPLSPAEAVELLAGFLGRRRVAADPDAVARLAHRCGYLPAALCAAGERAQLSPSILGS